MVFFFCVKRSVCTLLIMRIMLYFGCSIAVDRKGEIAMLKTKNQGILFKILSCVFTVVIAVLVLVNKKIIDFIYFGLIFVFVFKFFVVNIRK